MAIVEIIEKLGRFLKLHMPLKEECHVVYLLVEIRKVLDRKNNRKYPILRFYCNWSVHADKDSTKEMETIMNDVYRDVVKHIQMGIPPLGKKMKIVGFMYMEDLQEEMKKFLKEYQLSTVLIKKDNWLEFVKLFVKILVDQPINNPSTGIKQFAFLPAADGCVRGRVDFVQKIGKYDYYQFGNVY